MKKSLIKLGIHIVVIAMLFGCSNTSEDDWKMSEEITVPRANEYKQIISNYGSHGDGEGFIIADYDKQEFQEVLKEQFWITITKDMEVDVQEKLNEFQHQVVVINKSEKPEFAKRFEENPIYFNEGDLYYHQKEADGSYFILLLNKATRQLSIMEWRQ